MSTINSPILKEIAKIQSGIGLPPSTGGSGYGQCQAYTKNFEQCKRKLGEERELLVANLLSEFRHVTDYGEVDNFYDKMSRFIDLTHCHAHGDGALEAFSKWKTERIASASSSSSTLATNATFSRDSMETSSETSSVASPASSNHVLGSLECNPSTPDFIIEETMRTLVRNTNMQNIATQRSNDGIDQIKEIRKKMKRLGNVQLPGQDKTHDPIEIYKIIKNPPHARRMCDGIIYIYKHTGISGILKIGYSKKSAQSRHKQSGNCYGIDTEIIHATKKPFTGAFQAERIIHAILRHKQIQLYNCSICGSGHTEWFLTSSEEALEIVKCAESWLQMPAYTMNQGKYQLSPRAEVIYRSMFDFSLNALNQHMYNKNPPDDTSDVFSVDRLAAAVQEISIPTSASSVTGNKRSRGQAGKRSTTTLPIRPNEKISPTKKAARALEMMGSDGIKEPNRVERLRPIRLHDEGNDSDEGFQESDSGEDHSEDEPQELDSDEEDIEDGESEDLDSGEDSTEDDESQELGSDEEDEEDAEDEESQELSSDEEDIEDEGIQVRRRK